MDGEHLEEAKNLLHNMIKSMQDAKLQPDLILFSGDMLYQAGKGFKDISAGFAAFKEVVVDEMCSQFGLDASRFIFVPGNHDIDRNADSRRFEADLEASTRNEEGVLSVMQDSDVSSFTKRVDAYKAFEKKVYEPILGDNYKPTRFASTFRIQIGENTIGLYGLNTVWRCGEDDTDKIVLGLTQITHNAHFIEDCDVKIAMSHHRYDYLRKFEFEPFRETLAENCTMYFSGHAHSNHVEYTCLEKGEAFFDVNTAGSLVANEFVSKECHKNAFQWVVYYPEEKRIEASVYRQRNGQYFEKDMNFGDKDTPGVCERSTLSHADIIKMAKLQKSYLKEMEEKSFLRSIFPFQRIDDFPKGEERFQEDFVSSEKIESLIEQLRGGTRRIRFMALSGMGKTRIVYEAFKDQANVYYSPVSRDCLIGLHNLLAERREGVIIVDNCPAEQMHEVEKLLTEKGGDFKLVTIHNVLTPRESKVGTGVLLDFERQDAKVVIDKILKDSPITSNQSDLADRIKVLCGDIPYMVILMLQAYRDNHSLHIDSREEVLSALLNSASLTDDQWHVLNSVAMFDPLGKDGSVGDEYEYVTHNRNIHHIAKKQEIVDLLFKDTLRDYEKRQLIEHDGMCIRVRPLLLAEWLAEDWLEHNGEDLPGIIQEIQKEDAYLSSRLLSRISKRIKRLRESPYAQDVVIDLTSLEHGVFQDERIAFSNAGSQLYLSMGQVSPAAVAQNMHTLLRKKTSSWLKNDMDSSVRRNWVWALTNIAADAEAFPDAARSLMLLALAESEGYANNATGQFLQLFHIMLSGTMAPYEPRVELIEEMYTSGVDRWLLLQVIRKAYTVHGVTLNMNEGARDEEGNLQEYHPKIVGQIQRYWMRCKEVLEKISQEKEEYRNEIRGWLPNCLRDMCEYGGWVVYEQLMTDFYQEGEDWMEMYKGVSHYLEYGNMTNNLRDKLEAWQQKLTPKGFLNRLSNVQLEVYADRELTYEERKKYEEERMCPLIEEFVDRKLYEDGYTLSTIIREEAFHYYLFVQELVRAIEKDDSIYESVVHHILETIKKEPCKFESVFVGMFAAEIQNKERLNRLRDGLYNMGYYRMSSSVDGLTDDECHSRLSIVIDAFDRGEYDAYCVDNYLRRIRYRDLTNVLAVFNTLRRHPSDELNKPAYRFISYTAVYMSTDELMTSGQLKELEEVLLSYPYREQANQLAHEYAHKMDDILQDIYDPEFAFAVHRKAVETLSIDYVSNNPFEHIYFTLLPKYQEVVLPDLIEVLADEKNLYYGLSMMNHLGSGFGTGNGPLFQCDNEILKEACKKYPERLPRLFANMCPIYEWENEKIVSLSKFFLWLCDEFGDNVEVLHAFDANLNTFSWSGFGISDHYAAEIPYFEPLLKHPKQVVREWAKAEIESINKDYLREKGNEGYERMTRG